MPTIFFVTHNKAGEKTTLDVQFQVGQTAMQAALAAGLEGIAADCGGLLTCATCHVYVQEPWLDRFPAATPDELGMLDFVAAQRQTGSRLCCQLTLSNELDGVTVEVPATQY